MTMNEAEKKVLCDLIKGLQKALEGIASCATQCTCCEMHRRIAVKALGYEVEVTMEAV